MTGESAISVGDNVSLENSSLLRKRMQGMISHMAKIRGIINEFISSLDIKNLHKCVDNYNKIECGIVSYILAIYIAMLGMFHWFIPLLSLLKSNDNIEKFIFPLIEFSINTDRAHITFRRASSYSTTVPPHIAVLSIILWNSISEYIDKLQEALLYVGMLENKNSRTCFNLNILKLLLENLDVKISSLINSNKDSKDSKSKIYSHILPISEFYTAMVEPSARILVRQELDKLSNDIKNVIGYLLPRGFKIEFPGNCVYEDTGKVFEKKALCFYPSAQVVPNEKHVRNFVAHGGFTKLNRNWCLALDESCKGFAVCIEKPLDLGILLKIVFPMY